MRDYLKPSATKLPHVIATVAISAFILFIMAQNMRSAFVEYSLEGYDPRRYQALFDLSRAEFQDVFEADKQATCQFRGQSYALVDCAYPFLMKFSGIEQSSITKTLRSCENRFHGGMRNTCHHLVLYNELLEHPVIAEKVVDTLTTKCLPQIKINCARKTTYVDFVDEDIQVRKTIIINE